jgi:hypothetical protein
MRRFGAFKGKFAAGGSYSVNGVYIVINNLPFYQRGLIENMLLAMVIPGPHKPKGYAFEQMLKPLIDDLVALANGKNSSHLFLPLLFYTSDRNGAPGL